MCTAEENIHHPYMKGIADINSRKHPGACGRYIRLHPSTYTHIFICTFYLPPLCFYFLRMNRQPHRIEDKPRYVCIHRDVFILDSRAIEHREKVT